MKTEFQPWLLPPLILLTLSGVTLPALYGAARAAAPVSSPAPAASASSAPPKTQTLSQTLAYDDGDGGDELLEHWGDPRYSREERSQMLGMACGLGLLGVWTVRRRTRKRPACDLVPLPTEADFLKLDSRKAA